MSDETNNFCSDMAELPPSANESSCGFGIRDCANSGINRVHVYPPLLYTGPRDCTYPDHDENCDHHRWFDRRNNWWWFCQGCHEVLATLIIDEAPI